MLELRSQYIKSFWYQNKIIALFFVSLDMYVYLLIPALFIFYVKTIAQQPTNMRHVMASARSHSLLVGSCR